MCEDFSLSTLEVREDRCILTTLPKLRRLPASLVRIRYSQLASGEKLRSVLDRYSRRLCVQSTYSLVREYSMSQKRARSASPESTIIFTSSPIEDRSSKFIAFYSPTLSAKKLQAQTEIKSASHRIAAWRKPGSQRALNAQRLLDTGHDDDGEKYGGKALEKVLIENDVEGAVVVARWYGGVLLGPVRFDHIKNCARDAIAQWTQDRERTAKKAKTLEDEAEKETLIRTLPERDQSIAVLRDLLAEKSQQQASSSPNAKGTTAKVTNYATLPLATLQKLEQVRDATIGWILKQIEKVEETEAEQTDAAVPTTTEPLEASTHVDQQPANDEKPEEADLECQATDTTPANLDDI